MEKKSIGLLISLLAIGIVITGCTESSKWDRPEILKIASRTPALNATGVDYRDSLSLTFNFPFDKSQIGIDDLFAAYGSDHEAGAPDLSTARLDWSTDKKTLTVSGIKGWSNLTRGAGPKVVEVVAGGGKIKDIIGNEIYAGKVLWKFTLSGIGGVASVYPTDGATGVPTSAQIKVIFSEEMDASTINTDTFTLSGSKVEGTVSYDAETKTATLTPASPLEEQHTYVATIAASVKDKLGTELGRSYTWSFTTADETAPSVSSVSPTHGSAGEAPEVTITVTFDEAMDSSSLNSNTFKVGSSNGIATGTISYNSANNTATFSPQIYLHNTLTYLVTIAASVKDEAGNALGADYTWSFSIRDLSVALTLTYNDDDSDGMDEGKDIAADADKYIYAIGTDYDDTKLHSIWIRKYNSTGGVVFPYTYNFFVNQEEYGEGIAVDADKNIYVVGSENTITEGDNIWIRKYGTGGTSVAWTRTYNDAIDGDDYGKDIAVDSDKNVYVVGYETVSGQGRNIWVRKYDSSGTEVWTRTHNGSNNSDDEGYGIAVDDDKNVYVVGYEDIGGAPGNVVWVRKYNSSGTEVWTRTYNDPEDRVDEGYGIAVDADKNVYVVGYEGVNNDDIWVRKYDSGGNELWTKRHNGSADSSDKGYGIAVDGDKNVYVAGFETTSSQGEDIWIRKYDSSGNVIWTKTHNGSDNGNDRGFGIAVDGDKNIYVIGREYDNVESYNIWVRKYQP